jgi:acetyl-CoA acetyltransferase
MSNTNAIFSGDYKISDVLNSEEISSPLRELEIPAMTDGVCAIVIAREDWAKENKKDGITITGVGTASDAYYPGYRNFYGNSTASLSAKKAFQMSGIKPEEIQLAEIYELFPYQEAILYNEIFGWGFEEIREKLTSGFTSADGSFPVNASGGVTCAHPIMAAGLSRMIHTKKLMRERKLKKALTHSQSGLGMQSNIIYILEA